MARILTLTANTLLDHVARGALRPGKVNRVERLEPVAGGKGLNVARVLARHGHRVVAAGFAGGRTGDALADLVAADGIEPAFVRTAAATRIGFMVVDADGGSTAAIEGGFPVSAAELGQLVALLRVSVVGCDLVIASGSVPADSCRGLYRMLLDACAQAGVPCWIDAYGDAMDEALAHTHPPQLAKPNRHEYGEGRQWLPCRELHLTDGSAEIRVRHPDGRFRVLPPTVVELNPIGSGDCYLAALAHARLSGMPLEQQLRYAAAAGAANAARIDVARIAPADIVRLADQVVVQPAPE